MPRIALTCLILALAFALTACQTDTAPRDGTTTSADGVEIAYTVAGAGPNVVLVHCWCGHRGLHRSAMDDLANDHRVLALDLAGHGESGGQRADYTMSAFAGDVLAAMDAVGMDRAVLVGHSMGGTVVLEAARQAPERIVGLVGIDNLHQVEKMFTREQLDQFMAPMRADFAGFMPPFVAGMMPAEADSAQLQLVTDTMLQTAPAVGVSAFENLFAYDMPATAEAYRGRLHLVNDPVYPVAEQQWRDRGVDLQITWLEGVKHFPMVSAPDVYLPALRAAVVGMEESFGRSQ